MLRDATAIKISGQLTGWLEEIARTGQYGETVDEVALSFIREGARQTGIKPPKIDEGPPPLGMSPS